MTSSIIRTFAGARRHRAMASLLILGLLVLGSGGCSDAALPPATPTPNAEPAASAAPKAQPAEISTPAGATPTPAGPPGSAQPAVTSTALVGPIVGALAPDFTLTDLDGNTITLSDYRGKRVLVNFWATWCGPCRAELPDLQRTFADFEEQDYVVLGIDVREQPEDVRRYRDAQGLTFPIVVDDTGGVLLSYEVRSIPMSFFIDREGLIVGTHLGALPYEAIEEALQQVP